MHGNLLTAQGVLSILHTYGTHAITDEDHTVCTEQAEGIPYHTGMDMNAIADQLRHDIRIIRCGSHHSRLSMGRYVPQQYILPTGNDHRL